MTIGNEGKNKKATCNLGFVFLVDVASGTKVAFTREKWLGGVDDTSFDAEDLEGFVWTAPIGGVTAGTDVVCRGVGGFADASIEGTAIKATTASPISLVTSGEDYYTGGESCGSWVALNGGLNTTFMESTCGCFSRQMNWKGMILIGMLIGRILGIPMCAC